MKRKSAKRAPQSPRGKYTKRECSNANVRNWCHLAAEILMHCSRGNVQWLSTEQLSLPAQWFIGDQASVDEVVGVLLRVAQGKRVELTGRSAARENRLTKVVKAIESNHGQSRTKTFAAVAEKLGMDVKKVASVWRTFEKATGRNLDFGGKGTKVSRKVGG